MAKIGKKIAKSIFLILLQVSAFGQNSFNYAVQLGRLGNTLPVKIYFNADSLATNYQIFRKNLQQNNWGNAITNKVGTDTVYTDVNANNGIYEYMVIKQMANGKIGRGYLLVNTQNQLVKYAHRALFVIDENYKKPLQTALLTTIADWVADGWYVDTLYCNRIQSVTSIKNSISVWYNLHKTDSIKPDALYLIGRVPVPYSGDIFPDGHRPDHRGAWPADVYYGVMNESIWTDQDIVSDSATEERNRNIIGDGKFDLNFIFPDTCQLQIGRIDLTNMPMFGQSDTALVENYLNKAHLFKTNQTKLNRIGVIDDNFGALGGEAFASSAWRGFSNSLGANPIFAADYFTTIKNEGALLSYGCGPGTFTGATGVGTSSNFNNDSVKTAYTFLFGSYFGDWDNANNFLRAPLCSKNFGLTSAWSGRPHWNLHHLAMGYTMGYCARLAQNNVDGLLLQPQQLTGYVSSNFPSYVHIALMGDPSLRLLYHTPPTNLTATPNSDSSSYNFTWDAMPSAIGYEIYFSKNQMHEGKKVASITQNNFALNQIYVGKQFIHVKALYNDTTAAGAFTFASLGTPITVTGGQLALGNLDIGNPALQVQLFPNPSKNQFQLISQTPITSVVIYDNKGQLVFEKTKLQTFDTVVHHLPAGIYIVKLNANKTDFYKKLVVID